MASMALATLCTAVPATVAAQSPASSAEAREASAVEAQPSQVLAPVWPEGWGFGGSMGLPGLGTDAYPGAFSLGAHAHYMPRGGFGLEGSLGLAPAGLANGLTLGGRAGGALQIRTEPVLILPSAGVGALAAVSGSGADTSSGHFYAGLTTIHMSGLRIGVTMHWTELADDPAWLLELGWIRLPGLGGAP